MLESNVEPVGVDPVDLPGNAPFGVGSDGSAAKPRGRGRPRGVRVDASASVNPADLDGNASIDSGTGSAGGNARRSGTTRARAASGKEASISLDTMMTVLCVAQVTLLQATKIPEVMLTDEQNKTLAAAYVKAARHFPSVMTEKQQDIVTAIAATGAIFFAQFSAFAARRLLEKSAKAPEPAFNMAGAI